MTAKERTQAAARIITAHRATSSRSFTRYWCRCNQLWSPLHVAQELDKAGLLCALVEGRDA